jgi:hypothetical protein
MTTGDRPDSRANRMSLKIMSLRCWSAARAAYNVWIGGLSHGAADARRLNQTKSEILFASLAIASIRTPNEHPPTLPRDIGKKQPQIGRYL